MDKKQEDLLVAVCKVKDQHFGLAADRVREIIRLPEITPVHSAPPGVVGVMNLRGRIVTVMDLGVKLNLEPLIRTPDSRIFIVEWSGELVGLLTDAVEDVFDMEAEGIKPPPDNVSGVNSTLLWGVCRRGEDLVALIDIDAILGENPVVSQ